METKHGAATLEFADGSKFIGRMRLVSHDDTMMVWVGMLPSNDILEITTKETAAELEFDNFRRSVEVIKGSLDGFVIIQTTEAAVSDADAMPC